MHDGASTLYDSCPNNNNNNNNDTATATTSLSPPRLEEEVLGLLPGDTAKGLELLLHRHGQLVLEQRTLDPQILQLVQRLVSLLEGVEKSRLGRHGRAHGGGRGTGAVESGPACSFRCTGENSVFVERGARQGKARVWPFAQCGRDKKKKTRNRR